MYLSLQYALSKLLNPGREDFISMGLGIEARAERCIDFWRPHLTCTKEFQRRQIESLDGSPTVSVLGAGSLLDIDTAMLKEKFSKISLFDANPLAKRAWRKFSRALDRDQEIDFSFEDVTSSLDFWTESLKDFLYRNRSTDTGKLANFLASLQCCDLESDWQHSDVIFSVNLLSQIPVYWRDRVHTIIKKYWNLDTDEDGRYDEALESSLEYTMRELQQNHLARISSSDAKLVVIISDVRFMYYMKDHSRWRITPALYLPNELKLNRFRLCDKSQWFWHIAPQDVEQSHHGVIHDVGAWAFLRREPVINP